MNNILVLKHYKVQHASGWHPENEDTWPDEAWDEKMKSLKRYEEMKEMCLASAKKFLLGLDDIVIHETNVYNIQDGFKQHFFDLYDIWKQGNVNILYADLDVLFIREFNWFEFSDHFVMYHLHNSGIRYHGHDMDPALWDLAFEKCKTWNPKKWDYEQDIYKEMLHYPSNWEHIVKKAVDYSDRVINLPETDDFDALYQDNKDCCAIHFHGSRGDVQIDRMNQMFEFLKIS